MLSPSQVTGLPRDISVAELKGVFDELGFAVDLIWKHPVESAAHASATVRTSDGLTYEKMLVVSGYLQMRGVRPCSAAVPSSKRD